MSYNEEHIQTTEEQITFLRCLYVSLRKKCYDNSFRMMLTALLRKNDKAFYSDRIECLYSLMSVIENCLIRCEADRAMRYLLCMQAMIRSVEARMQSDCKRCWGDLKVSGARKSPNN